MYDALVIGGGVVGLSVAWTLARRGLRTALAEMTEFGRESSWAGAGILPPGNPRCANTAEGLLRAHSHQMWPDWSALLRGVTGIDNGYAQCGGMEVDLHGEAPLAARVAAQWRAEGVRAELLDARQARDEEPELAQEVSGACLLPEMGQVRNPRHLKALVAACRIERVALLAGCPIHGFQIAGDRATAADGAAGRIAAGMFVICGGAWSQALLEPLRAPAAVRPIRGQMVLLHQLPSPLARVINMGRRYLVPRGDGRLLVGSTEEETGFQKQVTAEGIGGLIAFGCRVAPVLKGARFEACWAGLRPQSADGLPYLGRVPGLRNVLAATGHFRAGLQLSPITALLIAQCALGEPTTIPLAPYGLERCGGADEAQTIRGNA